MVITYRMFGTTYRLQPQVKMGSVCLPETSVRNYCYALRNTPQERSSHLLRNGNLKLRLSHLSLPTDVFQAYSNTNSLTMNLTSSTEQNSVHLMITVQEHAKIFETV
jgi:hypothetical protein